MKDLFVYVADADAQAFLKSILNKPQALSIRPINFDIERHPGRDSGMVHTGAELARMKKPSYRKALITFDHHGSGRERRPPEELRLAIQVKLDQVTWKENSSVAISVPELEQWLWYADKAMLAHFGMAEDLFERRLQECSRELRQPIEDLKANQPKELFEYLIRDRLRQTISPRDFVEIGRRAGVNGLMKCQSFAAIVAILRNWFPETSRNY